LKDAAKFYLYVKKWLNLVVYGSHSLNMRRLKEDKKRDKRKTTTILVIFLGLSSQVLDAIGINKILLLKK
jgi:hypothetical protein